MIAEKELAQQVTPPQQVTPRIDIPSIRRSPSRSVVDNNLGLLAGLAGTWTGEGFNLIARPDTKAGAPLFLELNHTFETLRITPISSTIPNRGDAVPDTELFGLTYLQEVTDEVTKGALHIEPGIWIHNPADDNAKVNPPTQSVARMGTIPHGTSILAQGTAFQVPPAGFKPSATPAAGVSNTAPFAVAGAPHPPGTQGGFPEYNLASPSAFRTPDVDFLPISLPAGFVGGLQAVINDPLHLLDFALAGQVLNALTVITVSTTFAGGAGTLNIPFLHTNANAAQVNATFWIEQVAGLTPADDFLQIQYVQTVLLNFPFTPSGGAPINLSWPHVSVATLQKTFGGQ